MRNELELIEIIEKYLKDELSPLDKQTFEQKIKTEVGLKEKVEQQRQLIKGIERFAIKQQATATFKKYKFKKGLKNFGSGGLAIIITVAAIVYFNIKSGNPSKIERETTSELPALNENGEKIWSDADKLLPTQLFRLNPAKDTVFETSQGILFSIPANCFLNKNGKPETKPVTIEIKEALDAASIISSGLSSKSGDKLLESAGMFYINGRVGEESLTIDPNNTIYAEIPTNEKKAGMMLFEGKRMADGSIDWLNPTKLENTLTPVNIHTLDFYPPHYKDSLARMGRDISNKKFTDSLYYSFANTFISPTGTFTDTTKYNEGIEKMHSQDPGTLFKQNCATCHSLGKDNIVGPGLEGIEKRVPSKTWLIQYIKNNVKVYKSGDAYARKLRERWGSAMTIFEYLSDGDIDAIVKYISHDAYSQSDSIPSTSQSGINPAKIKTIWEPEEFQNTLLATKEFEERLKYMHSSCREDVLNLYINNLDNNLSALDSFAAVLYGSGTLYDKFMQFAARGEGRVNINDKRLMALKKYYNVKAKAEEEAIKLTQKTFWDKEIQANNDAYKKNEEEIQKNREREHYNYKQEYQINLKEAYRQLGYPESQPQRAAPFRANITSTGWKNVDAYVVESTSKRSTLNYTDPNSGKQAVIEYKPITVQVDDSKSYDKVFVYLIPGKLNSFMRMKKDNETFIENLNELMNYDMVCVGLKENEIYLYTTEKVKPLVYNNIRLKKVDYKTMASQFNHLRQMNSRLEMVNELFYQQFAISDQKRKDRMYTLIAFRNKIEKIIFPCRAGEPPVLMPVSVPH